VVSVTDPYGRILGFLDRSRYFSTSAHSFSFLKTATPSRIWCPVPHSCYFQTVGPFLCGAPSLSGGGVGYNYCWPSPEQLLSAPSPAELMTIFYCPRLETPQPGGPGSRTFPQEQGSPIIPPDNESVLFSFGVQTHNYPGTDSTENASSIIACSLVAWET
jgi:hypothetical protein